MPVKDIIELVAIATLPIGLLSVTWHRVKTKMGLGARAIQFIAVVFLIPVILILALEEALEPQTTATIIGALTGYLLSGIGGFEPGKSKPRPNAAKDAQPGSQPDAAR